MRFSRTAKLSCMSRLVLALLVAGTCLAQPQQQPIQDLSLLVGKNVIAQRFPLCQPGTFTTSIVYAGKQAKVISLKPVNIPQMPAATMKRFPAETRAMLEDEYKAATILVQFEDGTQLDSCGPVAPSKLSDYFELAPGETLPSSVDAQPPAAATPPATGSPTPDSAGLPTDVLSNDEVNLAVAGKGRDGWVTIWDEGLMAAQGNQVPSITLYTPEAVLAIRAEAAKKQFITYEPSEEEKRRSLMIVAQGYVGETIAEGCTSITRVVLLSDPSGSVVREAYLSEPLDDTWRNNFGATNSCESLRAKFSLDDVQKVKAAAPNGEFFVAVFSGSTNTKMYKVKKKYQAKLGLR